MSDLEYHPGGCHSQRRFYEPEPGDRLVFDAEPDLLGQQWRTRSGTLSLMRAVWFIVDPANYTVELEQSDANCELGEIGFGPSVLSVRG
jgi:hypothetical protein